VSYTDGQGFAETVASAPVGPVIDVNETPIASDNIILTAWSASVIPEWALLQNDVDPENDPLDVTNVANPVGGNLGHTPGTGATGVVGYVVTDIDGPWSFTYQATDGLPGNVATAGITYFAGAATVTGSDADEILIGNAGITTGTTLVGGGGNDILIGQYLDVDILQGGEGDDTYGFLFHNVGVRDGWDRIEDTGGIDTIALGTYGTEIETLLIWDIVRQGDDLRINGAGGHTNGMARVVDQFDGQPVEYLHFIGGATLRAFNTTFADTPYRILAADEASTAGNDFIVGGTSTTADTIDAGAGDDVLYGNEGNDILRGGTGDDILHGGVGDDTYEFDLDGGHDVIHDASGANDRLIVNANGFSFAELGFEYVDGDGAGGDLAVDDLLLRYEGQSILLNESTSFAVEWVRFAGGASLYGYVISASDYRLVYSAVIGAFHTGTTGQDLIVGSNGHDGYLGAAGISENGSDGNDIIFGLGGVDFVRGGTGNDLLLGGIDSDRYVIDGNTDGIDTIFDEAGASDHVYFDAIGAEIIPQLGLERLADDLRLTYNTGHHVTVVDHYAGSGNSLEALQFFQGANVYGFALNAGAYFIDDDLVGDAGQNALVSTDDSDTLIGDAGADLLFGNGGADVLIGGAGGDLLIGGFGNDRFVFAAGSESTLALKDTIADFMAGGTDDVIDLDAFDFSGPVTDAIVERSPTTFTSANVSDFFNDAGQDRAVVVEYSGGHAQVYVDANQDGNFTTADDLVVRLNAITVNSLTVNDFIFG
jgi:Ca2+-binding RTX toxin-like protein